MKELYLEIKRILGEINNPWDQSEKLFKTVKLDKGQFERIIHDVENTENTVLFPAIFIHFVNVSYLVSQNRIGEGRGTMRVRFILNRLNDYEDEYETEIFDYAGIVNAAIQDAKESSTILREKITLEYFDMPTTSNQTQACWLDFGVKFTDESGDRYRNYVEKTIITPAFTNFSDMTDENRDGMPDVDVSEYEKQVSIKSKI